MNSEKKIKIQQKIIEDTKQKLEKMEAENQALLQEIASVRQELSKELEETKELLEIEKNKKSKDYETVKMLLEELKKKNEVYDELIEKAKIARSKYKEQEKAMYKLKIEYNKKMKKFFKNIDKEKVFKDNISEK